MDIAVLIVDDFPLVRRGIAEALAFDPGIRVVGEAAGVVDGLELSRALQPDVVLLDLRLGDGNGIEMIGQLRAECEGLVILVMTAVEKIDTIERALNAGADGYLSKAISPSQLRDAIVTAYGRSSKSSSGRISSIGSAPRPPLQPDVLEAILTPREREVVAFVSHGHTDSEIADHLALSVRTVQNHLASVRRKLGLRSRSDLTRWALRYALH